MEMPCGTGRLTPRRDYRARCPLKAETGSHPVWATNLLLMFDGLVFEDCGSQDSNTRASFSVAAR
jgi:hypothetical protein